MRRSAVPVILLVLILLSVRGQSSTEALSDALPEAPPEIAFTFDDLPAHGPLPPGERRVAIAQKILAALRDANLPPVYGFVNAQRIEQEPGDVEVLKVWRDAGNPLGNHTWSHMNLNQHSPEDFEEDTVRNEPILKKSMKHQQWRWFRFPFLAEGESPEKRAAIRAFLAKRGYKIAAVTMSFGDYQWNDPYARCSAKKDTQAIEFLATSYLMAADQSITYYRGLSHDLYGRDIPYVLLMHLGAFDAQMMPRLLDLYKSKGFKFVTLGEAESDGFYRPDSDLRQPIDFDTLEEAMAARKLPLPARSAPPDLDTLCR